MVAAAEAVGLRLRSWRTLGRGAASHAAYSRALRAGRTVTLDHADIGPRDRVFHRVEQLFLTWHREAGEEAVLALAR